MKHQITAFVTAATTAALLAFASSVGAGEPAMAPPAEGQTPPSAQQPGMDVTDEKLRQFAQAAEEVQKIQEDYAAKAESLQKTTEEQIVASVQDAGMSVEEFTSLVSLVQSDPALARRLTDLQQ